MRDRVWLEEHQQPLPHPACDRAQNSQQQLFSLQIDQEKNLVAK
jgi:hypothetical protein